MWRSRRSKAWVKMMLFQTNRSYVFDFKRILINNRRKKSQECGVLDSLRIFHTRQDRLERKTPQNVFQF